MSFIDLAVSKPTSPDSAQNLMPRDKSYSLQGILRGWTSHKRFVCLYAFTLNHHVSLSLFSLIHNTCLLGFLTSSSTTRLYRGRAPRQSVWQFYVLPHMRQSWETMASVSAGHSHKRRLLVLTMMEKLHLHIQMSCCLNFIQWRTGLAFGAHAAFWSVKWIGVICNTIRLAGCNIQSY